MLVMHIRSVLLLAFPAVLAREKRGEKPLGPVDPGTAADCTYWEQKESATVTCESLQEAWSISPQDFREWNPLVKDDCSGMKIGNSYCVEVNYGLPRSTTSRPPPTPTTAPGNAIATPSPTQPGMVSNCNRFYFVKQGESCTEVCTANNISLADLAAWNPKVGVQCSGLWAKTHACVGVVGGIITTTTTTTTTSTSTTTRPTGNGIPTPQPTQPGLVSNCVKFHYVSKGNTCGQITAHNGISQRDFAKWNPRIGDDCGGMWADAHACVGIAAFSLRSRYHTGCSGTIHNNVAVRMDGRVCMDTDCQVGSLEIDANGLCPDGEVQLSYWEKPGCSGKWFGYGYANKGVCRRLWTDGLDFKAIHLRCARSQDDCVNKGTCTNDSQPDSHAC